MYVLATLAATLTLYAAVRWLDGGHERRGLLWLSAYILGALACLYTLYLAALVPLVANAYVLLGLVRLSGPRRLRLTIYWALAQVAVLALFVPWLLLALPRMHSWSVAQPFSARLLFILYGTLLALGISTEVERYLPYLLPFAATLLAGLGTLMWPRRRSEPGLPGAQAGFLLVLSVASLPLTVYLLTRPRHLFYTPRVEARYMLLFVPAFTVFLAWSIVRLGRRAPALALVALASCLGVMLAFLPGYYADRYLRDEMQTMSRILGTYAQPGDVILLISGDRYPLFYYYYERIVPPARRLPVVELPRSDRFTPDNVEAQLTEATAGHRRFWVAAVEMGIQDPQGLSLPWLDRHFHRALTHDTGHNALILYGDEPTPLRVDRQQLIPQRRLAVSEGGLELLGYDLPGRDYRAGDAVDLGLYYAAQAPVRVEVGWVYDNGELLASVVQEWPGTGSLAARASLRFTALPWSRAGNTHFLLRWSSEQQGEAPHTVCLPGPRVLARPGQLQVGRIAQPLDVAFAEGIRLRGYDLHRPARSGIWEVRPGEEITLDLFWETDRPVPESYTVFTHIVGTATNPRTGGPIWGQHDGPPVGGAYPTQSWVPGQVIADRHVFTLDSTAPAGEYELEVGLYLPATLTRLRVLRADGTPGDDRVLLGRIRVR